MFRASSCPQKGFSCLHLHPCSEPPSATEVIADSEQVPAFYPKTISCLYLCPTGSMSWLVSILPFQQCQQHQQFLLGSPAGGCNSTCKMSLLEQCSWNGNAVMEATPKHSVLQEFGVQLTLNGAVSRAHFSPCFSSPGV